MSRSFLVRVSPVDGADGAPATGATDDNGGREDAPGVCACM